MESQNVNIDTIQFSHILETGDLQNLHYFLSHTVFVISHKNEKVKTLLEVRIARLIKLVLNGWDDMNGDGLIQYDAECITAVPYSGASLGLDKLGHGGLQMAERALSGELGSVCDQLDPAACMAAGLSPVRQYTPDRDHDCVPEVSQVKLPAALANQITFQIGN